MPEKSRRQLDEEILHTRTCLKLSDYAKEMHELTKKKKGDKGEGIKEITERHAHYIISFLREFLQKDYGS